MKYTVRHVKFTPEEMAYDAPADVSDPKRFPTLAVGRKEWEQFLSVKRGYVKLKPELREAYPDDESVNEALETLLKLRQLFSAKGKKRKTA